MTITWRSLLLGAVYASVEYKYKRNRETGRMPVPQIPNKDDVTV